MCLHEDKSNNELRWSESPGNNKQVDHAADSPPSKMQT